jgi:hypothetical protein
MKRLRPQAHLWFTGIAVFALLLGLGLTVQTFRLIRQARPRIMEKISDLATLRDIRNGLEGFRTARQACEQNPPAPPVSIRKLLEPYRTEDIRESRRDLMAGWTLLQVDVTFSVLPLREVMAFVEKAESQRPPWRLTGCSIRPSTTPAEAQVTATLEAIQQTVVAPPAKAD